MDELLYLCRIRWRKFEIIENEDKSNPFNDDVLTELIAQKGFKIARRTVGKYREHMNIPPARLRKQL